MAVRVEKGVEPIPGYRLIERLGGGGFGEVWRAEAPGGMHKAIKFVFGDMSSGSDTDQRARQELKAMERVRTVRHPYILTLERYEVIDGQLIVVMELADRNLWDRFKECRSQGLPGIPREELLQYMEETAEALDLMNQEFQLQHLDIKPQNLFLVHNHVKVADFGLVKDLEGSQASITGGITPVYAAPETFDGKVSRYSDQYSLAIVFQELLTGQRPFNGINVRQLIMQHLSAQPNVSVLPPGDQPLIARSLSKLPSDRFPCCGDLARGLVAATGKVKPCIPDADLPPGGMVNRTLALNAIPPTWQGEVAPPPSSGPPTANIRTPVPPPVAAETGSGQGITQPMRAADAPILRGGDAPVRAPQEITGPGTLFPSVVIGLGQVGLTVMQRLREHLTTFVGPLSDLTNLRFLFLDTDPDLMRVATRGVPGVALNTSEVQLAGLNRPSYYLKPREGRPALASWFNPQMLYRIPRSQVTTGVRALGRLAFFDNYRPILRRLAFDLEAVLAPQALADAARQTRLGIRTNRPRVYVVTGLGGGTGSGMFIDVAYTVRALLRQMGFDNPDVVGLMLVPPVDRSRTRLMSMGNTYASLTELNYYGSAGKVFQARYHDREAPIQDQNPPFSRNILLQLPDESDEVATQEVVELSGQLLYRELVTSLGKAADLGRAELTAPPWDSRGQYFQTFNLFQLTWPRHQLLQSVARRLCQRLVNRWLSKDSKPLRENVQEWVRTEWVHQELGADCFIHRMQAEVVKAIGKPTDSLFNSIIDTLPIGSAQGEPPGRVRSRETASLDPEQLGTVLKQLEELVGWPLEDQTPGTQPRLPVILRQCAERLGEEWSQKLAEMAVRLIEEPTFRLAGAEEAIRQFVATIEHVLQHHEPLARDLAEKAAAVHEHLSNSLNPAKPGTRKAVLSTAETLELLRAFPKWRFQSMVLQHLASTFVSIRGHLSDELREVGYCRVRLTELLRLLDAIDTPGSHQGMSPEEKRKATLGKRLYLSGCHNTEEAVQLYLEGISADHLLELDGQVEVMLKKNYRALVEVCLTNANILKDVMNAMMQVAREYAASHMPPTSVAELLFEQFDEEGQIEQEIATYFDEAAPELSQGRSSRTGPPQVELCIVATPADSGSERFRQLLTRAVPHSEILQAASQEDILIYRERNNLALSEVEQVGPLGHNAYVQMSATENFTPHTRVDVNFRER